MKKWLCSPLNIHLVAKNSKCCILAIGEDISKNFLLYHDFSIFVIFYMQKLAAKSMTNGYKCL